VSVSIAPTVSLANGAAAPVIALGTWPMMGSEATELIGRALELGYRHLDTAEEYGNEEAVGEAVRASGLPREEVFVTTKFNARWHGYDLAQQAFEASAARLGVDYVDLLMIHWPNPWLDSYGAAWKGLIKLRDDGKVRAVGTSNFKPVHIDRLLAETGVAPELNQIQLDPTLARLETRAYHEAHGIVTGSWSPLGRGGAFLGEKNITDLAEKYGKSPGQIVLRWHLDLGLVIIPRSTNPDRLAQNIDLFDFSLTDDEVASITALDQGEHVARDSDTEGH
jgi:2,5-diketo-D-gluconate reductase A